jgi:hypothetical protein
VVVRVEGIVVLAIAIVAIVLFDRAALAFGADTRDPRWGILG